FVHRQGIEARKVNQKVVVKDGEFAIRGKLHVDFNHASAEGVRELYGIHSVFDRDIRIFAEVRSDSVMSDGHWPISHLQEFCRRSSRVVRGWKSAGASWGDCKEKADHQHLAPRSRQKPVCELLHRGFCFHGDLLSWLHFSRSELSGAYGTHLVRSS